jgi:peroxiredoxin
MIGRRIITEQFLRGACGLLLLLSAACNSSTPPAPAPAPKTPPTTNNSTTNKPPSKPEPGEATPAPLPNTAPQIAQPAPGENPMPAEQPRVDAPINPQVVPQVAQQNLYSAGQPPNRMPNVALSDQHSKSCPIKVGQDFPNLTLTDQAGKSLELNKARGRYTLVVLWSASVPSAVEEFGDLDAYAYQPYKNVGLNVVAVHTPAGKTQKPTEVLQKVKPAFTTLNDTNGELWEKLGKGSLPRTFLLDGQGKVLWFDIEYSRETRRQLQQALQSVIREI